MNAIVGKKGLQRWLPLAVFGGGSLLVSGLMLAVVPESFPPPWEPSSSVATANSPDGPPHEQAEAPRPRAPVAETPREHRRKAVRPTHVVAEARPPKSTGQAQSTP